MRTTHLRGLAFVLSATLLAASGGSGGGDSVDGFSAILTVTNLNNAGPGSLRDAVNEAPNHAGIVFDPELPVGSIQLLTPIQITKDVTINGLSGTFQSFTIDGGGGVPLFRAGFGEEHRLALWALVLTGANNSDGVAGGAIGGGGFREVVLRSVQAFGNAAPGGDCFGGVISLQRANLIAEDCAFTANHAQHGGAALSMWKTTATMKRCSFFLNSAEAGGAIWMSDSTLEATNCTFLQNQATIFQGGAIWAATGPEDPGAVRLYACTVVANTAATGGGVFLWHEGQPLELQSHHSIIAQNVGGAEPDIGRLGPATMTGLNSLLGVGGPGLLVQGFDGNQVGDAARSGARAVRPPQRRSRGTRADGW